VFTYLALVSLLMLVWLALSLPLAVLIGRCISAGQSADAVQASRGRGRLTRAAAQSDRGPMDEARTGRSRPAVAA
jgi:hypothetical protein